MRLDLFLLPLLTVFVLTSSLCFLFFRGSFFQRSFWRSGKRHKGKENLSRLGGVAMGLAFLITVAIDPHLVITREIFGLLLGVIFVCGVGLIDDFRELSYKVQALFLYAVTALLFVFEIRIMSIKSPFGAHFVLPEQGVFAFFLGFTFLLLWVFLVMNAVNWLDGLDGLLGSVSIITFLTVFFLSLKPEVNQPPVAILAIIAAGMVAGFLLFNIYPAKILAGTSGSMLLGFLITAFAVIAGTKIATALLVLVLPIADALWVIGERLYAGVSIFQADKRHLHYKLRELGWSEGHITWLFSLLTFLIAIIALKTEAFGKFIAFLFVLMMIFSFLGVVAYKTKKKQITHLT